MSRIKKMVKTEYIEHDTCDWCNSEVPTYKLDYVFMPRNGHHDGRCGKYAFCRTILGVNGQKGCSHMFRSKL